MSADFLNTSTQGRLAVRVLLLKGPRSLSEKRIEKGGVQTSESTSLSSSSSSPPDDESSSSSSLVEPLLASGVSGEAAGPSSSSILKTSAPDGDLSLVELSA